MNLPIDSIGIFLIIFGVIVLLVVFIIMHLTKKGKDDIKRGIIKFMNELAIAMVISGIVIRFIDGPLEKHLMNDLSNKNFDMLLSEKLNPNEVKSFKDLYLYDRFRYEDYKITATLTDKDSIAEYDWVIELYILNTADHDSVFTLRSYARTNIKLVPPEIELLELSINGEDIRDTLKWKKTLKQDILTAEQTGYKFTIPSGKKVKCKVRNKTVQRLDDELSHNTFRLIRGFVYQLEYDTAHFEIDEFSYYKSDNNSKEGDIIPGNDSKRTISWGGKDQILVPYQGLKIMWSKRNKELNK